MASWTTLPLELKHEIFPYLLPPVDDCLAKFNADFWFDTYEAGKLFVHKLEPLLLVSKAFSKYMQSPLEKYVRDLRAYRNNTVQERLHAIDNDTRLRQYRKLRTVWSNMKLYVNDRRKYVLRVLQHIRGRAPASWQSLPSGLRVTILEHVVPDICTSLSHPEGFIPH